MAESEAAAALVHINMYTTLQLTTSIFHHLSHCHRNDATSSSSYKKNTDYFYAVRISILLALLSEIFIQIGYFF